MTIADAGQSRYRPGANRIIQEEKDDDGDDDSLAPLLAVPGPAMPVAAGNQPPAPPAVVAVPLSAMVAAAR